MLCNIQISAYVGEKGWGFAWIDVSLMIHKKILGGFSHMSSSGVLIPYLLYIIFLSNYI